MNRVVSEEDLQVLQDAFKLAASWYARLPGCQDPTCLTCARNKSEHDEFVFAKAKLDAVLAMEGR